MIGGGRRARVVSCIGLPEGGGLETTIASMVIIYDLENISIRHDK